MSTPNFAASMRTITGFAAVFGVVGLGFTATSAQAAPPPHAPAWGYRAKQAQRQPNTGHRNRDFTRTYQDLDGDGIPNNRDRDVDGDGIPNNRDRDIDGDGISNNRDGSDYYSSRWRRSSTGQWVPITSYRPRRAVPAGYYRNSAGRLIRRPGTLKQSVFTHRKARRVGHPVGDADRDGIRNKRDRDIDGDGVRNWRDRNRDGDRFRNRRDRYPKNPRRH